MLTVEDVLADLIVELLRFALQTLLVDGVGLGGEGEPLRLECLVKVRDINLPHLCSQGPKNIDGFHDPPFDITLDVLEVEACRHADHAASDVVLEVTGEVFGGPIGGGGGFGGVAREKNLEERVILPRTGGGADVIEG